ncbi:MAG: molybdopterin molybdotransferase MoeA [Chthoniobacterales bacterium]|nr:molybdopterin molybdotransferase MoeA [Chthoniobacterales bacterium]
MTSEAEALAAVLAKVSPLPGRKLPLLDSLGRFAGCDLLATRALPPFDNSDMDGYAVQAASGAKEARLRVIGEQPAGADRGLTTGAGEAIRIFTGAPLPAGTDAIVMQEDVRREGDWITVECGVEPGEFIRHRGADLAEGQKILARGEPVGAQTMALLAAQGMAEIEVGGAPRAAIISTGDELVPVGSTPRPGQLFESNALMLRALALGAGAEVPLVEHCPDNLARMTELFRRGIENDALIVSGGVSVGDHDLVKPALRAVGAEIDLWRVSIKPGKPFLFGRAGRCALFGLPGNPVSAFVTFLKFVRPALRKMSGAGEENIGLRRIPARLAAEVANDGERPHYLRGRLQGGVFTVSGLQESHALFGLSRANALLRVASGEKFAAGAIVEVESWD